MVEGSSVTKLIAQLEWLICSLLQALKRNQTNMQRFHFSVLNYSVADLLQMSLVGL